MSAPTSPPVRLPDLAGLTLLVVDDDVDTAEILPVFLKACGASVLIAPTVSGALAYIDEARRLDAVVADIAMPGADIAMPGIDGVELVRKLRRNPIRDTLPIVAILGLNDDDPRPHVFDAFLKKPVNLDQLATVIASMTQRRNERPDVADPGGRR